MKKMFTHLIADAIDAKRYLIGVLLLLMLLLLGQAADAQTITSVSPSCTSVGEGVTLTINGRDFTVGVTTKGNKTEGNVTVIIKDNNGNVKYNQILEAFSGNEINNIVLGASVFNTSGTYTIQVANRDNTGSGFFPPTAPISFEVYPKLTIGQPSGNTTVCVNSTESYNINVAGAKTYEWSIVSGNATIASGGSDATAVVSFGNSAGSVRIGVRAFNQCDYPTEVKFIDVAVNALPVVTADNKQVCIGNNTVSLTGSPAGGTWSGQGVTGSTFSASGLAAGNYTVTYTYNNGCISSATATVTVYPEPVLTSDLSAAVCSGQPFSYQATSAVAGTVYSWSRSAVSGVSNAASSSTDNSGAISETLVNTTSAPVDVTYSITTTANGCASTQDVVVTVNPEPDLTSDLSAAVCSGQPFIYQATSAVAGTVYSWSRAGVSGVSNAASSSTDNSGAISETLVNTTSAPVQVTYSITLTTGDGCVNTQELNVTVNPTPVLSSQLEPVAVCSGATFSYTPTSAIAGANFTWTRVADSFGNSASGGTGGVSEVLVNNSAEPIQVTYVYTVSANDCDGPQQEVKVTVNPEPKLSSALSAGQICSSQPFSYTPASATSTTSFSWRRDAVSGISNSPATGNGGVNETLVNTTDEPVVVTYLFTTTANGCSTMEPVTVTVNPEPKLSSALTGEVCSGTSFSYTATSATSNTSFSWSRAQVSGISNAASSGNSATINETLANTTANPVVVTYTVTMTSNGCTTTEDVQVTVNPRPVLTSTLSPTGICSGATFSYTPTSASAGAVFNWSRSGDTAGNSPSGPQAGPISEVLVNTTEEPITVTYLITTTAYGCTGSTQSVTVTVNPKPKINNPLTATVCSGQPFFLSPYNNTPGATFSWSRAAVSGISNSAASGLGDINENLINTTSGPVQVTYEIISTANGCAGTPQNVTVTVNPQPSAEITPIGPTSFCQDGGNSVILQAPAGDSYAYQWYLDGFIIADSTAQSIKVTEPGVYNFSVKVTNKLGCTTTSSPILVKVVELDENIANITYTGSADLCEGESLLLQALENSNYEYQWNNEEGPISGANEFKYEAKTSGIYTVTIKTLVDDEPCEKTSDPITVTVTPALFNTVSSGDTEICAGDAAPQITGNNATGGSGTYTYLWESSTSSSSSGFTAATGTNNGVNYDPGAPTQTTWYRRLVTSGNCEVYSAPVKITVTPVITNNTLIITDKVVCTGQASPILTGRVPSGGNGTYTYQWEASTDDGNSFSEINGATAQDYNPGVLSGTTIFRRKATSGACESYTSNVKITVTPMITDFNVTADQTICSGGVPAKFTGAPGGGSGTYTYQWERSTDGTTFTAISGATAQEYTAGTLTADTWYRRKVSSGNCTVYSDAVKVTVTPLIGNTISTTTVKTCEGEAVPELSANAATGGSGTYTYTWESSSDGASFTAIDGTNSPTYSPGNLTQTSWYRRKVESGACTSYSSAVKVEVTPAITDNEILTNNFSVCYDTYPGQLTGSVAAGGNGNITYRWEFSTTSATEGFSPTGYDWLQNHSPGSLKQTTWYRRRAISGSCAVISNVVKITVTPLVANHTINGTSVYCLNASATALTGSFSGGSPDLTPTYKWQQSTSSSGPWADIAGATDAEYVPSTATVGKIYYRRIVNSDGCVDKASQAFAVTVNPIPAVNPVSNLEYCSGISVSGISFSSPVSGTTYSWTSTADVGFGTSNTGNIPAFTTQNSGTTAVTATITVTPTANGCTGEPITFTVTINPKPTVTVSLAKAAVCAGETTTVTAIPASGTGDYTYVWTVPSGATNPGDVSSFTASVAGTYRVTVTDEKSCSSASGSATLTINQPPAVSFSGVNNGQVLYSGQNPITLTGSPSGGTWSWPGRKPTSGNVFNPCEVFAAASGGASEVDVTISYTVNGSNGCSNTVTKTVTIKKSTYNVVAFSNIKPFCRGDNVTHTIRVYRDATVIYPYLVNAAGDPVRADGSPVGINELPVPNPDYPYPADATEIEKQMSYRFFHPIVTGGELLPASQFSYQWTKNQKTEQGNKSVTYSNAGLSSLEYYAAFVSGNLACGETITNKLSYRVYGAVLEDYNISVAVSQNPLCPGDPTTFTATLDSDFAWSIANVTMVWKLRRGGVVYPLDTVSGVAANQYNFTLSSSEIEAALAAQGVSPATFIDGDEVFIDFTSDLAEAFNGSKCNGDASSNPITMIVNDLIESTPTLANPVVCVGSTVSFTAPVSPTGTAQVTYTWTVGTGANAKTYVTDTNQLTIVADSSFTPDVTYPVSVVVTNGCVTTEAIALGSLTVQAPPTISVQPVPVQVCEGTRTEFTVTAAGSGITYQWLKDGQPIQGATSSTYVIVSPTEADEGVYSVEVIGTSACGNLTSSGATLIVDQPAAITVDLPAAGQTLCAGGTATYSISATGTDLQFKWFKTGGSEITPGGRFTIDTTPTGSTLTISSVEEGDEGSYYVQVSNAATAACAITDESAAPLVVNPYPVTTAIMGGPYCPLTEPDGATISVEDSEDGVTYSLMQGTSVLATVTGDGTDVAFPGTYKEGTYTISATNTSGCTTGEVGQTTVTATSVPVVTGELQITWLNNKTEWEIVALTDYADTTNLVYNWYVGEDDLSATLYASTRSNSIVIPNTDPELYVRSEIVAPVSRCVPDLELNSLNVEPLPVEIIYLTVEKQGSDVVLKWATAMEKDNTGFEVQVSNDGQNYRQITFVPTKNGNTTVKQLYEYIDRENGKHGTRYYRLKQLDVDGAFEYFGPKVVEFGSMSNKIVVYPNPFKDELEVSIEAEQDGEMEIVFSNSIGRQLIKTTVQVQKGLNTEKLLLETSLPQGVYFITTRMGSVTNHFKLLKQ